MKYGNDFTALQWTLTPSVPEFRSPRARRFQSSSIGGRPTDILRLSLNHAFTCFSNCFIPRFKARASRLMARILRRNARWSAIVWAERFPCFQFLRRHFSRPSEVVGPVLAPPCSRQRVYRPVLLLHIAGARHSCRTWSSLRNGDLRRDRRSRPDLFGCLAVPRQVRRFAWGPSSI